MGRALHIWTDFVDNLVATGQLDPSAPDYQEQATAISERHQQDAHYLSHKFARERQARELEAVLAAVEELDADESAAAIAAVEEAEAMDAVAAVAASMAG